jgi:Rod binding domain-containing protein
MNTSLSASVNRMTAVNPRDAKAGFSNGVGKNEKAARDFEAMLLAPVFESLQKTFAGDSEDAKTPGASDYRQMATQALAQSIAARGGIGIARLILRHLEPPKVSGAG